MKKKVQTYIDEFRIEELEAELARHNMSMSEYLRVCITIGNMELMKLDSQKRKEKVHRIDNAYTDKIDKTFGTQGGRS